MISLNYFTNDVDIVALREDVRFVHDVLLTKEGVKGIFVEDYPKPLSRDDDEAMRKQIFREVAVRFP